MFNDKLKEECGVFSIFNNKNCSELTYFGLNALQHRGEEGCGIVVCNDNKMWGHRSLGLVCDVFNEKIISSLHNSIHSIGHVRYSTTGGNIPINVQPFLVKTKKFEFTIAHNGNIVNSDELRFYLENKGSIFQTTSDTEVISHLITHSKEKDFLSKIKESLCVIEGAFSLSILTHDKLYAAVDRNGIRPLSIGKIDDSYIVSSETCALDVIGSTYLMDVKPGEIIEISFDGIKIEKFADSNMKKCSMEYLYFAQPNSIIDGISVYKARMKMGMKLWEQYPVDADVIIGVPESGSLVAMGMGRASKIPCERGIIKNRYIGRSFIKPTQALRDQAVRLKLSVVKHIVDGKRVIVVDDSVVRGTTSKKIVKLLREAGAKEVHFRSAAPPITHPCFYGIDTSTMEELIASDKTKEEINQIIGSDTLEFLSIDNMIESVGKGGGQCTACFSGDYPTNLFSNNVFQKKY